MKLRVLRGACLALSLVFVLTGCAGEAGDMAADGSMAETAASEEEKDEAGNENMTEASESAKAADGQLSTDMVDPSSFPPETTGMANPWTEVANAGELGDEFPMYLTDSDQYSNIVYRLNDSENMAEIDFDYDEYTAITYRQAFTKELEDITGLYYDWTYDEEETIAGCRGRAFGYKGQDEAVQAIIWYDEVFNLTYSLSASGKDLDGFDIEALVPGIYEKKTEEETLLEYMDEDFVTAYDVRYIVSFENEDSVIFNYYNRLYMPAGSSYVEIKKLEAAEAGAVIEDCRSECQDQEGEISDYETKREKTKGFEYIHEGTASGDSGLRVDDRYVAIQSGDKVILLHKSIHVCEDQELMQRVNKALDQIIDETEIMQ